MCNGPQFNVEEERTGLGGGFDERGTVGASIVLILSVNSISITFTTIVTISNIISIYIISSISMNISRIISIIIGISI